MLNVNPAWTYYDILVTIHHVLSTIQQMGKLVVKLKSRRIYLKFCLRVNI